jgi:hypothetical protein
MTKKIQITITTQIIADLEVQHPSHAGEDVALVIGDQTFTEIQTQQPDRWQKIRHQITIFTQQLFNFIQAALIKESIHYVIHHLFR